MVAEDREVEFIRKLVHVASPRFRYRETRSLTLAILPSYREDKWNSRRRELQLHESNCNPWREFYGTRAVSATVLHSHSTYGIFASVLLIHYNPSDLHPDLFFGAELPLKQADLSELNAFQSSTNVLWKHSVPFRKGKHLCIMLARRNTWKQLRSW